MPLVTISLSESWSVEDQKLIAITLKLKMTIKH